jgi:ribonucleoside-diphosphate reductase subunit M1
MKNMIIANNGSIQSINGIPDDIKAIYKTVWEISQKKVLDLAADRGAFICQSQSLNVHLQSPTVAQLTSMHFYGWKKGLKTGMYYLRTRPAAQAIQFTVDQSVLKEAQRLRELKASGVKPRVGSMPSPSSTVASSPAPATPVEEPMQQLSTAKSADAAAASAAYVPYDDMSLDERTRKAAAEDPEFAAALARQKERELEQAKLMCSIENKEACLMCSA